MTMKNMIMSERASMWNAGCHATPSSRFSAAGSGTRCSSRRCTRQRPLNSMKNEIAAPHTPPIAEPSGIPAMPSSREARVAEGQRPLEEDRDRGDDERGQHRGRGVARAVQGAREDLARDQREEGQEHDPHVDGRERDDLRVEGDDADERFGEQAAGDAPRTTPARPRARSSGPRRARRRRPDPRRRSARSSSARRPTCPSRASSGPGAGSDRSSRPPPARARRAAPGS